MMLMLAPTCSTGVSIFVAVTVTGSTGWIGVGVSCAAALTQRTSGTKRMNQIASRMTTPFASKGGGGSFAARSPDSWIDTAVQPSRDDSQWLPRGFGRDSPLTVAGPCRIEAVTTGRTGFPWTANAQITGTSGLLSPPLGLVRCGEYIRKEPPPRVYGCSI